MPLQPKQPKLIIICGPTGTGKTRLAIELAQVFHGEIIGADSMQIYRHMDIGTAKPTPAEQALVPHHLINIVAPDESFDAQQFAHRAQAIIRIICDRQRLPLVVGGTGFYIKALLHGLFKTPRIPPAIRRRLKQDASASSSAALHTRLHQCDPEAALRIHPQDAYRVVRALEVFEATGQALTKLQRQHRFAQERYRALKIGLWLERQQLYAQIDRRAEQMIAEGLLSEVHRLLARGYGPDLKSMQAIGYRHMTAYLKGTLTWEEAVRTFKRDTRRYAKRQLTWFKADPDITWVDPRAGEPLLAMVRRFIGSSAPRSCQ